MQDQKALEFNSTAGAYFLVFLVSIPMVYVPFFGWAFIVDYTAKWFAKSTLVNGKPVEYTGVYGETLKLVFVQLLLVMITFGIYMFWAYPKIYKYIAEHINYVGGATAPAPAFAASEELAPVALAAVEPEVTAPTPTAFAPSTPPAETSAPEPTAFAPSQPSFETPQEPPTSPTAPTPPTTPSVQ